jgi:hypothetical protein
MNEKSTDTRRGFTNSKPKMSSLHDLGRIGAISQVTLN